MAVPWISGNRYEFHQQNVDGSPNVDGVYGLVRGGTKIYGGVAISVTAYRVNIGVTIPALNWRNLVITAGRRARTGRIGRRN